MLISRHPRPLRLFLLSSLLLGFGTSCGDDDAISDGGLDAFMDASFEDATADVFQDTTVDAAPDVALDARPDVALDARPDVELDAPMDSEADAGTPETKNVLLIIADDCGTDPFALYDTGSGHEFAETPTIDGICEGGIRFENAWSAPTCTPTRGSILTGRYGFRTGIVEVGDEIGRDEMTLPRVLAAERPDMRSANIGKWHLGTSRRLGGNDAPNTIGWDHYSGPLAGGLSDYFDWEKVVDGAEVPVMRYATTENVEDALAFVERAGDAPWFLWLAFNAPHLPFHVPPEELLVREGLLGTEEDIEARPGEYHRAALEALDAEVGRLLGAIDRDETDIVFLCDNGSPARAIQPMSLRRRAKATLYQGGVHVPMCIAGPSVREPGRTEAALVHSVDLFSTLAELADATPPAGVDSMSLMPYLEDPAQAPIRMWNMSENMDGRTIRDDVYKLIVFADGTSEVYNLVEDPLEERDLSEMLEEDETLMIRIGALRDQLNALSE